MTSTAPCWTCGPGTSLTKGMNSASGHTYWICRACNNATPTMQMSSDVHRVSTLERLKRFFGRESAQPLS